MSEPIGGQEAIEILKANYPDPCFEQLREAVDLAIGALKAQQGPKIGKIVRWMEIRETHDYISYTPHRKCSLCGNELLIESINYCYMCGAKLI